MFYRLVGGSPSQHIPRAAPAFCLFAAVIDAFGSARAKSLTFGLIAWGGFRETAVEYHRPRRLVGSSSWTIGKMVKSAIDTFVSFSFLPIRAIFSGWRSRA